MSVVLTFTVLYSIIKKKGEITMKRFRAVLCIMACALCSLLVLGGCKSSGDSDSSVSAFVETVNVTTKVKYEGVADEGSSAVPIGEDYTLRAYDTNA